VTEREVRRRENVGRKEKRMERECDNGGCEREGEREKERDGERGERRG
jgi:hypothetical protein